MLLFVGHSNSSILDVQSDDALEPYLTLTATYSACLRNSCMTVRALHLPKPIRVRKNEVVVEWYQLVRFVFGSRHAYAPQVGYMSSQFFLRNDSEVPHEISKPGNVYILPSKATLQYRL